MGSVVSIKFCKAKKLSEQGDALEQFVLGLMYMGYSGVEDVGENHQEGIKWLKRSAEQENIEAKVSLGFHLAIGKVVERDINKALPLLLEGARDGHWFAQLIGSFPGPFGGRIICQKGKRKAPGSFLPDALSSFFDSLQYSSGQERSEDDIRATLDDIYTTWGDIFFHTKNAINFQKFL